MIYHKTEMGRAALLQRNALNLRERQIVVLCNGVRASEELAELFGATVADDIGRLERKGFLVGKLGTTQPAPLEDAFEDHPGRADAAVAEPPTRFMASELATDQPPAPEPDALPRMSLEELTALADVPPVDTAAIAPVRGQLAAPPAPGAPSAEQVAANVNRIDADHLPLRSPLAAQAYMTQVLIALERDSAIRLVESHGDVQHDVDILLYLAQGVGEVYAAAGEDVTLRVALRLGRLLPEAEVPMLLDCVLDYVPAEFNVLLYEFVLAGRENAG